MLAKETKEDMGHCSHATQDGLAKLICTGPSLFLGRL